MAYDEARLVEALRNADAAGDFEAAAQIAQLIQRNRAQPPSGDPRKQYAEAAMAAHPARPEAEVERDRLMAELAAEQGPIDAFLIGAGKGFYNVGRGLGLVDQADDTEKEAYAALEKARPIAAGAGEIVGSAAPFIPAGLGVGGIAATAPRVAATAGLGALEGGVTARGQGADNTTALVSGVLGGLTAGALDLALPVIVRAGGQVVRRVTGQAPQGALLDAAGRPTQELADALAAQGMTFDDLAQQSMRELTAAKPGANPTQAARAALFAQEGIPATRGNITKEFGQETIEQRLANAVSDPAADPFRAQLLRQSEAFRERLDDLVKNLGVPERTGASIKDALSGRKALLSAQKSQLYKQAAEQAENLGVMPIIPDNIAAAIPDEQVARRIGRLVPGQASALDDLLVEFGVKQAPEGFAGKVTPLSVGNLEDFRSAINLIERSDQSGTIKVLSGPIKDALDAEADMMADAVQGVGGQGVSDLLDTLRQARGIVREAKTEFSPQALAGRLIKREKDGVTPTVEASKVAETLFSKSTPVEQLTKTMANLAKAGEPGRQAIGDLQSATVLRILDDAFGATSRTIDGVRTLGPGTFQKALAKIGDDKLNVIFSGNKEALTRIRNLEKIAAAIQPASGAVPKGSASTNLDIAANLLQKLGVAKLPGVGLVLDAMSQAAAQGQMRRNVATAMNASPQVARAAADINRSYPALAAALGISAATQQIGSE